MATWKDRTQGESYLVRYAIFGKYWKQTNKIINTDLPEIKPKHSHDVCNSVQRVVVLQSCNMQCTCTFCKLGLFWDDYYILLEKISWQKIISRHQVYKNCMMLCTKGRLLSTDIHDTFTKGNSIRLYFTTAKSYPDTASCT